MKLPRLPGPVSAHPVLSTVAVLGVLVAVVAGRMAMADGSLPSGAVLRVGDVAVDEEAFEHRVAVLEFVYGLRAPDDEDSLDAFRRDVAKAVAVGLLLDERASEMGIEVAERAARDNLDRYIEQAHPAGGRSEFLRSVGSAGLSERDILGELRRQLTVQQLYDRVVGDVEVDSAAVRRAFDRDRDQFVQPELRRLRHLVVATEAESSAALARLHQGEAFEAVAEELSLDGSTKSRGGDLGTLPASELDPAFAEAAFAAEPGVPFGPVQTQLGWHLGLVESVVPEAALTFDEVRDQLAQKLSIEAALDRWRGWLADELRSADIVYADRYRPAEPEAPPPIDSLPGSQPGSDGAGTGPGR